MTGQTEAPSLVSVGDLLELRYGSYLRGVGADYYFGQVRLRVRVTRVESVDGAWHGDWLTLTGVEVRPEGPDGDEVSLAVHRRALPGYRPPPSDVPEQGDW